MVNVCMRLSEEETMTIDRRRVRYPRPVRDLCQLGGTSISPSDACLTTIIF